MTEHAEIPARATERSDERACDTGIRITVDRDLHVSASEPEPLSRAVVETGIRAMLASRDSGRLSTEGFVSAVMILFDSVLDGPEVPDTEVAAVNDST